MEWKRRGDPNARDLAKRFVLLDNFYSHAELSIQGHEWTTGCIANDYVEKGWGATEDYGRGYRPDTALTATSLGRLGYPGSDSIWVHLDKAGVPYPQLRRDHQPPGRQDPLRHQFPGPLFQYQHPRRHQGPICNRQHLELGRIHWSHSIISSCPMTTPRPPRPGA